MDFYLYMMFFSDARCSTVLLRGTPALSAHVDVELEQRTGAILCLLSVSAGNSGLCLLPAASQGVTGCDNLQHDPLN